MRAEIIVGSIAGLLAACSVGNTGNPNNSHPEGIELLRSELARDMGPDISAADQRRLAGEQRAFAFELYAQLAARQTNLFFSPYSVATSFAMTYAGADADTKSELAAALHFSLPDDTLHAGFNNVNLALAGRERERAEMVRGDTFQFRTTNATFVECSESVKQDFLDLLARNYDAGVFLADFAGQPDRERQTINRWVSERSEQRINELLAKSSVDSSTRLVLVNAVYFKASWLHKFDAKSTSPKVFHGAQGDVDVPMISSMVDGNYARMSNYQVIELAYVSPSVRMLIVFPDEGQFASVEATFSRGDVFEDARAALSEAHLDLGLPRFTVRSEIKLKQALTSLGVQRAFVSGDADFSRMAGAPGELFIDDAYHQAFVEVDENGTEAAAATAIVLNTLSAKPSVTLTLDRPFLFLVYDEPTGQILFEGRFIDPG